MSRLIGQPIAETILARAIATERLGHAYLFLGPAHTGKATAAAFFAQAINCGEQPAAARVTEGSGERAHGSRWRLTPCGRCESCRRIAAHTHPEVLWIHPDSESRQNISIDQAREIRANAALRPKLGTRRVYVFANAEALSEPAANALLKTLEEPSLSVMLVLCAPHPGLVLPTIRSRCQPVRFGLTPRAEVESALTDAGADPEHARALAAGCAGRPGIALGWLQHPEAFRSRATVLEIFLEALEVQGEAAEHPWMAIRALKLAERLRGLAAPAREKPAGGARRKGKKSAPVVDAAAVDDEPIRPPRVVLRELLGVGLGLLRDVLLMAYGAGPDLAENQDYLPALEAAVGRVEPIRLAASVGAVREAQELLDRNVTPALVLERMFWTLICGVPAGRAPVHEGGHR